LLKQFVELTMPAKEIPSILSVNHKVATREAGPYKNLGELD
jgi:hypothetical protein